MVELLRLLLTLVVTAIGYRIGTRIDTMPFGLGGDPATPRLIGSVLGAFVGYVVGGVFGRRFEQGLDKLPTSFLPQVSGPQLFAGAFGVMLGIVIGLALSIPILAFAPLSIGWSVSALLVVVATIISARLFASRADDLLSMTGLRQRGPLVARRLDDDQKSYIVDSSAAIDGRILELAKIGLIEGQMWIPAFVIDELQGLADSAEKSRRRRGRRGLEVLDALQTADLSHVAVLEDEIPEFEEVDAKLLALADRAGSILATTDTHLAKAAEIRGIRILNPGVLGENLKPLIRAGEVVRVPVTKPGTEAGQGVGYMDDGTMVVIDNSVQFVGQEIDVEITSTTKTAIGRMLFGRPV